MCSSVLHRNESGAEECASYAQYVQSMPSNSLSCLIKRYALKIVFVGPPCKGTVVGILNKEPILGFRAKLCA